MSHQLLQRSLEAVDYQADHLLFTELQQAIQYIRNTLGESGPRSSSSDRNDAVNDSEIEKIIKKHTGLRVNLDLVDMDNAYVYPPNFNKNHVFMKNARILGEEWLEQDLEKQSKKKRDNNETELLSGDIDLKNARVTGDFSDVVYHSGLGINLACGTGIGKKLSVAHVAAILIHEIGHIFTFLEQLRFTTTVTHTLHEVGQIQRSTKNEKERFALAKKRKLDKVISEEALEKSLETGKESSSFLIVVTTMWNDPQSMLGTKNYDSVQSESVADQFAARQGAGQYVVEGLDVLHKSGGGTAETRWGAIFLSLFINLLHAMMAAVVAVFAPGFAIAIAIYLLLALVMDFATGGNLFHETYDQIQKRFERVRKDLIQTLKDDGITDETRKELKEQIEKIDAIMEKTFVPAVAINAIFESFPSILRTRSQEKMIERLEDLTHNEFFRHANDFKVDHS